MCCSSYRTTVLASSRLVSLGERRIIAVTGVGTRLIAPPMGWSGGRHHREAEYPSQSTRARPPHPAWDAINRLPTLLEIAALILLFLATPQARVAKRVHRKILSDCLLVPLKDEKSRNFNGLKQFNGDLYVQALCICANRCYTK